MINSFQNVFNFYSLKWILTHLAYIANGEKMCYIVQQFHWANKRDIILHRFDAILVKV